MKILEAILAADRLQPNNVPAAIKLGWLSAHDGQLQRELYDAYGLGRPDFAGYGETTDVEAAELLAPPPWDELYPWYLAMRLALAQGELETYNEAAALYRRLYQDHAKQLARTHRAIGVERLEF